MIFQRAVLAYTKPYASRSAVKRQRTGKWGTSGFASLSNGGQSETRIYMQERLIPQLQTSPTQPLRRRIPELYSNERQPWLSPCSHVACDNDARRILNMTLGAPDTASWLQPCLFLSAAVSLKGNASRVIVTKYVETSRCSETTVLCEQTGVTSKSFLHGQENL